MLVADGPGDCLLSSLWLLLLDDLLHADILCHTRDDYKLIDIENPLNPTRKIYCFNLNTVTDVGWRIRFPLIPPQNTNITFFPIIRLLSFPRHIIPILGVGGWQVRSKVEVTVLDTTRRYTDDRQTLRSLGIPSIFFIFLGHTRFALGRSPFKSFPTETSKPPCEVGLLGGILLTYSYPR